MQVFYLLHIQEGKGETMLKLKISGTKNDLKSFRKWITRAMVILPKYKIDKESDLKVN